MSGYLASALIGASVLVVGLLFIYFSDRSKAPKPPHGG